MLANTRQNRRTLRQRSAATRFNASLKRGRSLATHMIAAEIDPETAKGMVIALRGVAKRTGMKPAKITRTRNTVDGKGGRMARLSGRAGDPARREAKSHIVYHFTALQVQTLLNTYKPRKASYAAAKAVLAAKYALAA
jgi:hypothetical protein